jgi:hypothetical protein
LEKRTITYVVLALLVWAVCGTVSAGYYFTQYDIYRNEYRNLASEFNVLSGAMGSISDVMESRLLNLSKLMQQQTGTIGSISDVMESISLRVNILVSYGNGTRIWHNDTALPVGSTAFTAILAVGDARYKDYGGDLGILVTSVDGLAGDSTHGWFYWYRDTEKLEWVLPEYSCAKYILHRGDVIAFTYESYMMWPPPSPS